MARIVVEFTDGTFKTFEETSRSGGSYHTYGKTEEGWYIITDAYGNITNIPSDRIKMVRSSSDRW